MGKENLHWDGERNVKLKSLQRYVAMNKLKNLRNWDMDYLSQLKYMDLMHAEVNIQFNIL